MYQDFFEGEKKKKRQYAYKCYTNFSEKQKNKKRKYSNNIKTI